jgi:hypothetical protein
MLKGLDFRYKYLLSVFFLIVMIGSVGYLLHRNHSRKIYSMSRSKIDSTSSSIKEQQRISLSAEGTNKRTVDLTKGLVELSVSYSGNSNILVNMLNRDGEPFAKVLEHYGPCIRKRTIFVPESGQYILDVKCEGKWSITGN